MDWRVVTMAAAMAVAAPVLPSALAAGNLSKQAPIEVRVDLGKQASGEHRFPPGELTCETGKLYRLVLHNPSRIKHYFSSLGLAGKV